MVKNSHVILAVAFFAAAHLCAAAAFDVRSYGAKGDGAAKDTAAIDSNISLLYRRGAWHLICILQDRG